MGAAGGQGDFTLDGVRGTLHHYVTVNDIQNITAARIHFAPAGQNGPVVFTLYPGAGLFDPAHPIGSGVMLNAQNLVDLLTGFHYVNVHTGGHPSGEIRGQIGQISVEMQKVFLPVVIGY